ncbi:YgaP family membrane protein [Rhodocista pekingensis]|uniref:DUF2892 domain-containing protein n=1 Tax=Rhodocista pekingensis TaxID=201185 RepID=A0ABW2L039_9PROT
MVTNVGSLDRALRFVIALALLSLLVLLEGNARWLGLIGLVPLTTATLRWCPLYTIFGINTGAR